MLDEELDNENARQCVESHPDPYAGAASRTSPGQKHNSLSGLKGSWARHNSSRRAGADCRTFQDSLDENRIPFFLD